MRRKKMTATKTATIKVGGFTRQLSKATADQAPAIEAARQAADRGLIVLVKRDHAGRWQAFGKRRNPLGAVSPHEYERVPGAGRRARRIDVRQPDGAIYLLDSVAATGEHAVEVVG